MKLSSVSFSFRSLLQTCFYGLTASTAVIALLYPEQSVTFLAQNFDFWIAGEFIVVCSMAAFLGCRPGKWGQAQLISLPVPYYPYATGRTS